MEDRNQVRLSTTQILNGHSTSYSTSMSSASAHLIKLRYGPRCSCTV